ncbi:MAG: 5-formyltetrahydrofolate cyclo-ligase [Kiritimatiellia bacterium]
MDKSSIREKMRAQRHELTEAELKQAGKDISHALITSRKLNLLLSAWNISTYISTTYEIPTRYLIAEIWNAGRNVSVPVWDAVTSTYKLCALLPRAKFVTGPFGVREPALRIPVQTWDMDAFIMPGLAFDMYGARLGFGAGFYDRILSEARSSTRLIGICHDWQVVEDQPIPQEPHDIRVDWIVTDKRTIRCGAPPQQRSVGRA